MSSIALRLSGIWPTKYWNTCHMSGQICRSTLPLADLMLSANTVAQCRRAPLTDQSAPVVHVSDVSSLRAAVRRANTKGKLTIVLAEGEYLLQRPIGLTKNHITVRSLTGDREQVVLRGQGMSGRLSHIFQISGRDLTIADLTAGWVRFHVAQIHAEKDADRVRLHNVRFVDAAEQIVKVSYRKGGPRSDDSVIEWSLFEFSAGHAYQAYTGGIGALGVRNLTIRNNVFRHIRVPLASVLSLQRSWSVVIPKAPESRRTSS